MEISKRRLTRNWREGKSQLIWAKQRLKRGWDSRAFWNTDHWLAESLGAILRHASMNSSGYPSSYPGGASAWRSDLFKHGCALTEYAEADTVQQIDENLYKPAQEAMFWVANNFGSLWD